MKATIALLSGALVMLHAAVTHAAPFELEWSAPAGCPSREKVVAATLARLGEGTSPASPELFVRGDVVAESGAFLLTLHLKDREGTEVGERHVRFDEPSCQAIEAPTALVLAMMIAVAGPRSTEPSRPAPSPGAPDAPLPPAPPPSAEKVPAPPPGSHPRRRFEGEARTLCLGLSGVSSLGLLPNIGIGSAVRVTTTVSAILLGVEASFETAPSTRAGAHGGATLRFFDAGLLGGLRAFRSRAFELVPLVQVRGGLLIASAEGFPTVQNTERLVGIVALGVLGRAHLGRSLRLDALPDIRMPIRRDEFQVREGTELLRVHQPTLVEARVSLGISWEFR